MINLQISSGLPLLFNTTDNSIHPAGEISLVNKESIKLDSLRSILLNKTLRYPVNVYTEYKDICLAGHEHFFKKNSLHYSISIVPSGLLGVEYTKTHIFSPDKDQNTVAAIADVLYGKGAVLVQKIKEKGNLDYETEVCNAQLFLVKPGDRIAIPQKHMYTFINSSNKAFIVGRLYENDGKIDYRTIWKEQGMCYYLIRKNARREIVRNPRYKTIPKIENCRVCKNNSKYRITAKKPLYTQFIQNPQRFKKMLV